MTIDEAIKHCEDKASANFINGCTKCAEEHLQLARWLRELKEKKKMTYKDIPKYGRMVNRDNLWKENRKISITEAEFSQAVCELIAGSEQAMESPLLGLALLTFGIQIHEKIFNYEREEK